MIIEPKGPSLGPIQTEVGGIMDLIVLPYLQTRDDYRELTGADPPPPDPARRAKHWFDPTYAGMEDDGEMVPYRVLHIHPVTRQPVLGPNGQPRLTTIWLSKAEAGSVNIPQGTANEFSSDAPIMRLAPVPPPLRELHPDERLEIGFGGLVQVVNTRLRESSLARNDVWTSRDREILHAIARKLGIDVTSI